MVGVAVKITAVPEHVGLIPVVIAMLTDDVRIGLTTKAIALLVAVGDVTQVTLLVITTVILPAVVPASVYVEAVWPVISTPAFFHWYDRRCYYSCNDK